MSAVVASLGPDPRLTVMDSDGALLDVLAWRQPATDEDPHVVTLATSESGTSTGAVVGLDLADGLALLSFLADALGVERLVPGGAG